MMTITDELMEYLEQSGNLRLDDGETAQMKVDLQNILAYMDLLREVDPDDAEAAPPTPAGNVFREDEVQPSADRELLLRGSECRKDGCFVLRADE